MSKIPLLQNQLCHIGNQNFRMLPMYTLCLRYIKIIQNLI